MQLSRLRIHMRKTDRCANAGKITARSGVGASKRSSFEAERAHQKRAISKTQTLGKSEGDRSPIPDNQMLIVSGGSQGLCGVSRTTRVQGGGVSRGAAMIIVGVAWRGIRPSIRFSFSFFFFSPPSLSRTLSSFTSAPESGAYTLLSPLPLLYCHVSSCREAGIHTPRVLTEGNVATRALCAKAARRAKKKAVDVSKSFVTLERRGVLDDRVSSARWFGVKARLAGGAASSLPLHSMAPATATGT